MFRVEIMKPDRPSFEADGDVVRMVLLKSEESGWFVCDIWEVSARDAPRIFARRIAELSEPDDIVWPEADFGRAKSILGKTRKLVERATS